VFQGPEDVIDRKKVQFALERIKSEEVYANNIKHFASFRDVQL
jgi:hypothetical protein